MARRHRGEGSFRFDERSGLWVGEVSAGYAGGKRVRKRVTAKTQRAALAKFNQAREDLRRGITGADCLLSAWLEEWLRDIVEPNLKPKTARTYRTYCEQYLIPILGRKRLSKLEGRDIRELHRHMRSLESRRGGGTLSETTVGHAQRVLGTALNAAARDNKAVHPDVVKKQRQPKDATRRSLSLTFAQVRQVLAAATAAEDRLASRWLAGFLLGARQGEVLGLRWSHVDLEVGVADLAWSLQRVHYTHGRPDCDCGKRAASCPSRRLAVPPGFDYVQLDKGLCLVRPKTLGSTRVVPLAPPLLEALRLWRRQSAAEPNPHDLVWHRPDGKPLDGRRDYDAWLDLLVRARLPKLPLHSARHTTNSLMLELGVPEPVRMQILGHSVVATNRLYAHVDQTQARAALDAVGDGLMGDGR